MTFLLDKKKIAQAAAFLLDLEPGKTTEYLRLLKLLYMADRESLREKRRSITNDDVFAMKDGPVLSETYDTIKQGDPASEWGKLIEKDGYFLRLRQKTEGVPVGRLSKYERQKLREVSERCHGKDVWTVRDLTHDFPEWEDPGRTSIRIPLQKILAALGLRDEAREVVAETSDRDAMAYLLSEKLS
jgi:uncharacterized phage-associated protein